MEEKPGAAMPPEPGSLAVVPAESKAGDGGGDDAVAPAPPGLCLVAKWAGTQIELVDVDPTLSLGELKVILEDETDVPAARQKIVGLKLAATGRPAPDAATLAELDRGREKRAARAPAAPGGDAARAAAGTAAAPLRFVLMGTPEGQLFVDPNARGARDGAVLSFEDEERLAAAESADDRFMSQFERRLRLGALPPPFGGLRMVWSDVCVRRRPGARAGDLARARRGERAPLLLSYPRHIYVLAPLHPLPASPPPHPPARAASITTGRPTRRAGSTRSTATTGCTRRGSTRSSGTRARPRPPTAASARGSPAARCGSPRAGGRAAAAARTRRRGCARARRGRTAASRCARGCRRAAAGCGPRCG